MSDESDPWLWSVDRSWGNVAANIDGEPYYETKLHIDRGDTTAKCSRRILLNSLQKSGVTGFSGSSIDPDKPSGRLSEFEGDPRMRRWICRRCAPMAAP